MPKYSALMVLNKFLAAAPLILLLGCDAGREREFDVAIGAMIFLAVVLTPIEVVYFRQSSFWGMFATAAGCVAVSAMACVIELAVISRLGKLGGPVGSYGIISVAVAVLVAGLVGSLLCAWVDSIEKRQPISLEQRRQ